jgi:nucleoside-diphosphate-sugar epimerase
MKSMLTGGTGFVGGNLAGKLAASGDYVKCLVRKTSNVEKLKNLGVEIYYGDLSDFNSLLEATRGVDLVYHCAALVTDWGMRKEFHRVNVEGTRNVLKACEENGVQRVIHVSSSDAIWRFDNHIEINENYPYPKKHKHPYNETKAESEKLTLRYDREGKLETVIIRPAMVWGPGDKVILPRIVQLAINRNLVLIGNGSNLISLSYIENLTDAMILAGEKKEARGKVYFINDDIKITFADYISRLLSTLGIEWSPVRSIPYFLAYGLASVMEMWAMLLRSRTPPLLTRYSVAAMSRNFNYSTEKAKRELNYQPKINLNEGLQQLKDWFDSIGGISGLMKLK